MIRLLPLLAISLLVGGCGKEMLAGGQGEAEVVATDGAPSQASPSLSPGTAGTAGPVSQIIPPLLEGTLELEASVALVHTSDAVENVTASPVPVTLGIGRNETVLLGRRAIPTGRYIVARITFDRVAAVISAGLDATGVEKTVEVEIGPEPLVVEKLINLVVGVTDVERLQIDLNSSAWIPLEVDGLVDADDFADAIRVGVV